MAQQEPLFAFSTEYDEEEKEVPESIYDGLVEVIEEIQELPEKQLEQYRVVWESKGHDHSTSYSVRGLGSQFGETTIEIRGGRGGEYYIFPKQGDVPWIKYENPNKGVDGWEEPLVHLIILKPDTIYEAEDRWGKWFREAYSIVEKISSRD